MGAHDYGDHTVFTKEDNELPEESKINWGYNCLTAGIHHGRPEPLWNLPLLQAFMMFGVDGLKHCRILGTSCSRMASLPGE
jgi:hypothetical protein